MRELRDSGKYEMRRIRFPPSPHQFIGVCLLYPTPQTCKSVQVNIMSCVDKSIY